MNSTLSVYETKQAQQHGVENIVHVIYDVPIQISKDMFKSY